MNVAEPAYVFNQQRFPRASLPYHQDRPVLVEHCQVLPRPSVPLVGQLREYRRVRGARRQRVRYAVVANRGVDHVCGSHGVLVGVRHFYSFTPFPSPFPYSSFPFLFFSFLFFSPAVQYLQQ